MKAAADMPAVKKEKPATKQADVYQTVADLVASTNNGQLLRWRVDDSQLIILLEDGRKFYKPLEG
jgi:hypothetical protein